MLFNHTRILQTHLKTTNAKKMLAQRILEFFDAFEILSDKLTTQSKFARLKERVLKKINQNKKALISIIINFASRSISQAKSTMFERLTARDLRMVVKHLDKRIIESLRKKIANKIVVQINKEFSKIQKILSVFEDKVIAFKQLRSENVALFTRRVKNVTLFNKFIKWIKMFEANAWM